MLPRAGFRELTDDEVADAVRYMLSTLKLQIQDAGVQPIANPAPSVRVDDRTLAANVAAALRPRISGVAVEARDGRVVLRGMVENGKLIREAEALARAVPGVVGIENHLVGADLFEHD
jgi:osmotically-inducible protein OsmY